MSLQKYTALLKTVELGSISQAAEQMGYTQPAVSRMIADLEREWDVELLHRSRGGLEPSSVCQRILPFLRSIQSGCEELEYTIEEYHGMHTGLVRMAAFATIADMWLPNMLKSFHQLYPDIEFDLINFESYAAIEEQIRHGKVDCGFVSLPTTYDLDTNFLMRDELVVVMPTDHPMADAPFFPIERLSETPFIKCRERVDFEIARFLEHIPYTPDIRYEVSSDHTIMAMVESGLGISITHSLIAETSHYKVATKRFDHTQYRDIAIATAKNARVSAPTRLFIDHVCSLTRECNNP